LSANAAACLPRFEPHRPPSAKVRRLYDIANIFLSLKLIRKLNIPDARGRKPAFSWIGCDLNKLDIGKGATLVAVMGTPFAWHAELSQTYDIVVEHKKCIGAYAFSIPKAMACVRSICD
jgi:hypothetical protein